MLYIVSQVFRHADVIYSLHFHVLASVHNSGQNCLLPYRPDFGLNIKFYCISCCILFHRFLGMLMPFLAFIFMFRPPYTIQALNGLLPNRPDFGLNIKFDCISCYILFQRFSGMLMSFVAVIFMFRPQYTIQALNCLLHNRPDFGLNIKFDCISCYIQAKYKIEHLD